MQNKRNNRVERPDYLSKLVLWRYDKELVEEVQPLAEAGDPQAQYAMGLIYAEGRGVTQDNTEAYKWLSFAGEQGDEDAYLLRSVIMQQMDFEEINKAEQLISASCHSKSFSQ